MKWFRHETNSLTNLKLQGVIEIYGMEGYGFYWACIELVGLQGEDFRIKSEKNWKIFLKTQTRFAIEKQDPMLQHFADIDLIDKKALQKGDLYAPKMDEYSDDYTKKKRRVSEQDTENIPLHNITIQNNTEQDITLKKDTYGEFEKVKLTLSEYQKLIERLSEKNTRILIAELDSGIASKGYKYKSHYATILNWARRKYSEHQKDGKPKRTIA